MPQSIDRNEVRRLVRDESAIIIDALPKSDYEAEHITGAINLPIKELNAQSTAFLLKSDAVIVYCWDMQ